MMLHRVREGVKRFPRVQAAPLFASQQLADSLRWLPAADRRGVDPKGAAMDVDLLHIEDLHAETREKRDEGPHRKIREMLVIDRVVFEFVDEVLKVRRLENEDAVLAKELFQSTDEGVKVVDVREDIRGGDYRRAPFRGHDLLHGLVIEKVADGVDAVALRQHHDRRRGIDSLDADAALAEGVEEDADVASDVDHQIVRAETEHAGHALRELVPVLAATSRRR